MFAGFVNVSEEFAFNRYLPFKNLPKFHINFCSQSHFETETFTFRSIPTPSALSVLTRSCCEVVARRDSDTEFYLSRQSFWWFLLLTLCSQL